MVIFGDQREIVLRRTMETDRDGLHFSWRFLHTELRIVGYWLVEVDRSSFRFHCDIGHWKSNFNMNIQ